MDMRMMTLPNEIKVKDNEIIKDNNNAHKHKMTELKEVPCNLKHLNVST